MSRQNHGVHLCSFDAVDFRIRSKGPNDYAAFRTSALAAGRFSVFEATETPAAAALYTRLCRDPAIRTRDLGFPWTGVEPA